MHWSGGVIGERESRGLAGEPGETFQGVLLVALAELTGRGLREQQDRGFQQTRRCGDVPAFRQYRCCPRGLLTAATAPRLGTFTAVGECGQCIGCISNCSAVTEPDLQRETVD